MTMTKQEILREAAKRIEGGEFYSHGNYGDCNCGHVAQVITGRNRDFVDAQAIHVSKMSSRFVGSWANLCQISNLPVDHVLSLMFNAGFSHADISGLENLNDPDVLNHQFNRKLVSDRRSDVIAYMRAWADMLDEQQEICASASDELKCRPVKLMVLETV